MKKTGFYKILKVINIQNILVEGKLLKMVSQAGGDKMYMDASFNLYYPKGRQIDRWIDRYMDR